MKDKLAIGIASGCTAAALLYSILRVVQAVLFPDPDPTTVLWTEHSGFFWRAWTCAYAAGAVALVVHRFANERVAALLARAIVPVTIAVIAQAIIVP